MYRIFYIGNITQDYKEQEMADDQTAMDFEFLYKNQFGNDRFYPVSAHAKDLLALMNRSSLTDKQYNVLVDLGWPVSCKAHEYTTSSES